MKFEERQPDMHHSASLYETLHKADNAEYAKTDKETYIDPAEETVIKFREVSDSLLRKFNMISRDQRYSLGVSLAQSQIMDILAKEGPLPMSTLASRLGVAPSTATRTIDILVRKKLASRSESCSDRRKVCMELTRKGIDLLCECNKSRYSYAKLFLDTMTRGNREYVLSALSILDDSIGKILPL